jgi:hypothetical protein
MWAEWRSRPDLRPYGAGLALTSVLAEEATMNDQKQAVIAYAAKCLGMRGTAACHVLDQLWDVAFEQGRLSVLAELAELADRDDGFASVP